MFLLFLLLERDRVTCPFSMVGGGAVGLAPKEEVGTVVESLLGALLFLIQILNGLIKLIRQVKALRKQEAPPAKAPQR